MDKITKEDVILLIGSLAEDMISAKDYLTDLDAAIGDGDLGVTMTLGFRAIQQELKNAGDLEINEILSRCGMAFADNAASTFGALMSTMFMRAGRVTKDKESIGPEEVAEMLAAAAEGVQKRGKAEPGDKTVLDAMLPASESLSLAVREGATLLDALQTATDAARKGAEETVGMKSKAGRSGWLGDRTIGVMDPGAAAFVLIIESVTGFIENN